MEDLQTWYRQGLSAFIDALEIAQEELKEAAHHAQAVGTFQRVAQSLSVSGKNYDFPEISRDAAQFSASLTEAVQSKDYSKIEEPLNRLTGTLKAAVSGEDAGEVVNVLIVDDDAILANLLKARLDAPNRNVTVVGTGAAADNFLLEKSVSLILLDLTLPDIDAEPYWLTSVKTR